ncbi:pupal cuticle protein Edg-91-like [Schistocerca serialis cubense]|uniref:pupal cuticle protein Edg-91-like n=1 Tax=Schistocerca serialis cubense TaxID=2023355 RepID=UPI00214EA489|nr:pupal cuticle protein Edg-91-like [Schistocerca serialis cubense]
MALVFLLSVLAQHACAGGMGQDDEDDATTGPRRGRTFGLLGNALFGEGLLGGAGGGGGGLFGSGRPGLFGGILEGLFGGGGVRPLPILLLGSGGWLSPFRRPYRPSPAVPYYPRPYGFQGYLDDDGDYYYRGGREADHLVPEFH